MSYSNCLEFEIRGDEIDNDCDGQLIMEVKKFVEMGWTMIVMERLMNVLSLVR